MKHLSVLRSLLLLFFLTLGLTADARSHRRPSRKSPHAEITAVARVVTAPIRNRHRNQREFEELDIQIESFQRAPEGDFGGDPDLPIQKLSPVHVVHDLTCGGIWLDARTGDRIEVKGEYVQAGSRGDLIHFTHPADGSCGRAGGHPGGYLRKHP